MVDHSVPAFNLSVTECSLGIICVSIPALRPLFQRMFPNSFRSDYSTLRHGSRNVPLKEMMAHAGKEKTGIKKGEISISNDSVSHFDA